MLNGTVFASGASTGGGGVDATCVQFVWLRGKEFHLQGGRIPPDIWVIHSGESKGERRGTTFPHLL